jgi:hypothetical protein
MTDDVPHDLTDTVTQSVVSEDAAALLEAIIESSTDLHFSSLVHGVEEAYEQHPAATTATLAHALKLADKDCSAKTAAQATVAALIAGGGCIQCMALAAVLVDAIWCLCVGGDLHH